ncbi:MAG: AMP-dependent synthetase/ligase [Acidimicrobiia bacterium]|nr:MAG: AMP-dependent synthetase/ligase [Acidimicrobiia bacterium]
MTGNAYGSTTDEGNSMAAQIATLVDLYTNSVTAYADNPLFGHRGSDGDWTWLTYGEFGEAITKARGGLASLGITTGDRVAIISDNRIEWAVGAYATYSLGAAWVPMYEAQTQKDWKYILKDSGAKVLFAATDGIRAQIEEIQSELPDLEAIVVIDDPAGGDAIDYLELLTRGAENPVPVAVVASSDLAGLIYTSGTTGDPKGVTLSHGNFASNINAVAEFFPLEQDDRSASFLPWAHSFGQTVELHALTYFGASTGLTSAKTLTRDMPEIRPTILVSVPTVFNKVYDGLQKMMEAEGGIKKTLFDVAVANARKREQLRKRGKHSRWVDLQNDLFDKLVFTKVRAAFGGRLKYAFSGGAAISTDVAEFISAVGITVYEGYGLTETSPIVTANTRTARRIGSVGRPIPDVTLEIDTDVTGDPEIGEIVVHGPNVMMGYYNLPEANAEVFTPNHGFRTGDLGHVDADGYLFIRGRIKEQYKLENGKYVVPSPIEEQLQLSGFISQVMVYGEQRPYNVAVVVPDFEYVKKWATDKGLDTSNIEALLSDDQVVDLLTTEINRAQSSIKHYERVRDFVLESEEFTPENGMLTPSLKIKRRAVMAKFGDRINALYDSSDPLIGRNE